MRCVHTSETAHSTLRTFILDYKNGTPAMFAVKCECCGNVTSPCFYAREAVKRAEHDWWAGGVYERA